MRGLWIICIVILAGCDSPGVQYAGQPVMRVEAMGQQFSLRRRGDRVEIIRTTFDPRPDIGRIGAAAERIVKATYGCPVQTMQGDVALMVADLDCTRPVRAGDTARWVCPERRSFGVLGFYKSGGGGSDRGGRRCT